jgi:hypothetical protein
MPLIGYSVDAAIKQGPKLSWAPPKMKNPKIVDISNNLHDLYLRADQDYIVRFPPKGISVEGGLAIRGGHNIVIIGGYITIPRVNGVPDDRNRRALLLEGQTGTVHVEGLLIDNAAGDLSEGIDVAAPRAVVQIQNCRIDGVHARDERGFTDNHPDIVQVWGGVAALRIDRLSGITDYQGLFLQGDYGQIGSADLRHVDIRGAPTAQFLFWVANANFGVGPVHVSNVWVVPPRGRSAMGSVWPNSRDDPRYGAREISPGLVDWPVGSTISGDVHVGWLESGPFVPAERVSPGAYRSPGYGQS